jgi:ribosomal protein L1
VRYQLVVQFAAETVADYDALVAIEHQLITVLGEDVVDGHDMGSGEANIFILTSDPQKTFRQLAPVLEDTGYMPAVTAAYRLVNEDRYHVLWPQNSTRQFSVA